MSIQLQSPYLSFLRMDHFGRFHDKIIGPFSPYLNVVYGPNEAGKTTAAAFVDGVLFGWEEARGRRNTYKPSGTERAGSLVFTTAGDEPENSVVSRERNADGLLGETQLVDDIDRETFRTVFSLNSDELRSLRGTSDTTAKLLTAGSGTGSSPAEALGTINEQLAVFTSRAASVADQSIPQLIARRNDLRQRQEEASKVADGYRAQNRELHDLEPERAALSDRVEETNRAIEALSSAQTALNRLEAEKAKVEEELRRFESAQATATQEVDALEMSIGESMARLDAPAERALRDRLESLSQRQIRQAHATETAEANYVSSKAVYEALLETVDQEADARRERSKRRVQLAFSVIVPLVLFLIGVPLFLEGSRRGSLSTLALGALLAVFAIVMLAGGFALLFRPERPQSAGKGRFEDAHWVMVQDKKKLEARREEEAQLASTIAQELDAEGFGDAAGSLRQAQMMLDEAREARGKIALARQRQQASALRCDHAQKRLEEIKQERASVLGRADLDEDANASTIEEALTRRTRQRTELMAALETMNQRAGELSQILAQAEQAQDFDHLKIEVQEVTTRLEDARADFARLLLARKMLQAAVATWESKRQPEVYARASELLSLMTDGRWTEVLLTEEGNLKVADPTGGQREPLYLSLGTCQQLYLALRIALLICADKVGRAIPVLADDILVNFDATRRLGAAQALVNLARYRQVIVFTCHEEVVRVLKKAAKREDMPLALLNL